MLRGESVCDFQYQIPAKIARLACFDVHIVLCLSIVIIKNCIHLKIYLSEKEFIRESFSFHPALFEPFVDTGGSRSSLTQQLEESVNRKKEMGKIIKKEMGTVIASLRHNL